MGKLIQLQEAQVAYAQLNEDVKSNHSHSALARRLFDKAIKQINSGFPLQAMSTAREALIYAKYSNSYRKVYIHSFLAMTNMESGKLDSARIHCWQALQILEERDSNYAADKRYLGALYEEIESKHKRKTKGTSIQKQYKTAL